MTYLWWDFIFWIINNDLCVVRIIFCWKVMTYLWWYFIFWLQMMTYLWWDKFWLKMMTYLWWDLYCGYDLSVVRFYMAKKWWPMCGESYIRALCAGTSGCEGRSCCTLCRCVKVYFSDWEPARISHFPQNIDICSTLCARVYPRKRCH